MLEMADVTSGSSVTLEMGWQLKSIVGALHCGIQYFSLCALMHNSYILPNG